LKLLVMLLKGRYFSWSVNTCMRWICQNSISRNWERTWRKWECQNKIIMCDQKPTLCLCSPVRS
jgi:hypothetical protein